MDWQDIYASRQNQTAITATVTGIEEVDLRGENVYCLVTGPIRGLIPLSETGIEPGPNKGATLARLTNFLNQEISFVVIGIDRENEFFIASRKQALEKQAARAWQSLKENQIRNAVIRRYIKYFKDGKERIKGAIIEIDGVEGLLPVQEISHGFASELPQPGKEIPVKILKVDPANQKLVVSYKAVLPDPWENCAQKYKRLGIYTGTVTGVAEYGVFVSLEPGVNVLCRHLKAGKTDKGDKVAVLILKIMPEKRQISGIINKVLYKAS